MSTRDPSGRPMGAKEPFEELRRVLETRVRSETPTADCVDDDIIAAVATGTVDPALRGSVLAHVATCPRCRASVASVARALADPGVAREIATAEGQRRRFYRLALPVAAAAALLLLVWPGTDDRGPVHRGPTITATSAPVPLSPLGAVADAAVLRWAAVPGADRYRVTLFDTDGQVQYETQTGGGDTLASLPDSIVLAPGRYLWKVEARTGFDRWTASELVEFSIVGGRPR